MKKIKAQQYNYFFKKYFRVIFLSALIIFPSELIVKSQSIPDRWDYEIAVDERVEIMQGMPVGPFVRLGEKEILSASSDSGTDVLISEDNGQSWKPYPVFKNDEKYKLGSTAVQRTEDGIVILAFSNPVERHWTWDDELGDAPGAKLPTYVVRSMDNGRTWEEPKKLHDEWTGMNTHMIITSEGNIVFTSMKMLHNPGRHSVLTYMSEDQGNTWHASNIIDLGGAGHHGGVTETTIEELQDGLLMGLMRTNWMELWRIESNNGGRTWHPIGPSGIAAASTHARLIRLESERLLLIWNRPYPDGESSYHMVGGDRVWSAVPVSNYRSELSVAFSEDYGDTWSDPVVIARTETGGYRSAGAGGQGDYMPRREVAYPFAFEINPGEIWITTGRGPLRAKIYEKDFINE